MSGALHLTVTTPGQILVDSGDVPTVRAEDESGGFGILPGHADLLTALVPSVVRWRTADGSTHFCGVRSGVFTVSAGHNVTVACREGVLGTSLEDLEAKVRAVRTQQMEPKGACRAGPPACSRGAPAIALSAAQSGDGRARQGGGCLVRGADFDRLTEAAQRAAEREAQGRADPEPSLGARLGQIGILGWTIVLPTLLCLFLGRWLDRIFGTGIFFSAPLLMAGAAFGFWSAWRWMHHQGLRQ